MIISRLLVLGMEGNGEIVTSVEFCRGGKFSELRAGLYWMEAELTGMVILEWLGAFAMSAENFPSLTMLEMIEFCTGATFLLLREFFGHPRQLKT